MGTTSIKLTYFYGIHSDTCLIALKSDTKSINLDNPRSVANYQQQECI